MGPALVPLNIPDLAPVILGFGDNHDRQARPHEGEAHWVGETGAGAAEGLLGFQGHKPGHRQAGGGVEAQFHRGRVGCGDVGGAPRIFRICALRPIGLHGALRRQGGSGQIEDGE
ncbi:MAG: hypothetical protein CMI63_18945 [Parvularcula sp.]|nr:hypothetical protein [Parvularcula sp.]